MLSFGVGSYFFFIAMQKDITENLKTIQESSKNDQTVTHGVAHLADFIQIHSLAKQLSKILK